MLKDYIEKRAFVMSSFSGPLGSGRFRQHSFLPGFVTPDPVTPDPGIKTSGGPSQLQSKRIKK